MYFKSVNEKIVESSPSVASYKAFKDLKVGDKLYKYTSKKIVEYPIVDIKGVDEVSVDWSYNHQRNERTAKYVDIYYQENKKKVSKIILEKNRFKEDDRTYLYTYRNTIFSDKKALGYYIQYMYNWRKQRIANFEEKIAKEQKCIDNYIKLYETL